MPINVIKIVKQGRNRVIFEPGLYNRYNSSGSSDSMYVNNQQRYATWGDHLNNPFSSVYVTSEIDAKITSLNDSIYKVKEDCKKEIADSLVQIQKDLITLKKDILSSKTFRESIKNEILQELREELNITNS